MPDANTRRLRTQDRNLIIDLKLEENTLRMQVRPMSGDENIVQLTFTRGFARELRDFLAEADTGGTNFGELS